MNPTAALRQVRPIWISRSVDWLSLHAGWPAGVQEHLSRFDELFCLAVETGQPERLLPGLENWLEERTLEEDGSLLTILNQLVSLFFQAATEVLQAGPAASLLGAALPVFACGSEFIARKERERHAWQVAQELEKTRQALERLEKSKSDFISVAAHELKTPLTLIEGYADMLRELPPGTSSSDPFPLLLQGIRTGTIRLREIIDDMIDVSLIDNQMLALNYQPVWLNRLFHILAAEFSDILESRRLTFTNRAFPGSSDMTFGDAERLLQAFRNLLMNAIKYTPDGGKISLDGRKLPGFFEITVADTGIGIDPQDHERVFEKFGRLGNAALHSSGKTKFKGGGPGLGLPITKGILEAHGGAIWIESEGHDEVNCPGTTFHVLLPERAEPPDEKIARLFRAAVESGQPLSPAPFSESREEG